MSNFQISGQSFITENFYNTRSSDDTDINHRPVTKLNKRNKTTSKKITNDVLSENCDVIVTFRIFGQFGAVRRADSGHRVCKIYVFINRTFSLAKTENRTKKSLTQLSHYFFQWRYFLGEKTLIFCKKKLTLGKWRGPSYQKAYFLKLNTDLYLRAKFEVSSVILWSFRQGLIHPRLPPSKEPLKSPLGLNLFILDLLSRFHKSWVWLSFLRMSSIEVF